MTDPTDARDLLDTAASTVDAADMHAQQVAGAVISRHRRERRQLLAGAAAALVVAIAVAALAAVRISETDKTTKVSAAPTAPANEKETASVADLASWSWSALPTSPMTPRLDPSLLWTGTEMIVWGGHRIVNAEQREGLVDGAIYNPHNQEWRLIPSAPLSSRTSPTVVWTGEALIVWGGWVDSAPFRSFGNPTFDGAAFDPATGVWRAIATAPTSGRTLTSAWTGDELIVVQGPLDPRAGTESALAYDPRADRWSEVAMPPPYAGDPGADAIRSVWTGSELLMWRKALDSTIDLVGYEPRADRWRTVPETGRENAPNLFRQVHGLDSGFVGLTAIGDGSAVVASPGERECDPINSLECSNLPRRGARFDVARSSWQPIAMGPSEVAPSVTVWTGAALLVVSSDGSAAAAWDPPTDAWTMVRAPGRTTGGTMLWTGLEVLTASGLRFGPSSDASDRGEGEADLKTQAEAEAAARRAAEAAVKEKLGLG